MLMFRSSNSLYTSLIRSQLKSIPTKSSKNISVVGNQGVHNTTIHKATLTIKAKKYSQHNEF